MAQVKTQAVEVVPDRLYRLGAMMPLDGRISWVRGMVAEALVEVVDLEEHPAAIGIERAKLA